MFFIAIITLIIGFILLIWSADRLVDGAASIAQKAGIPALTIGLTIVALGTSLPEIMVSVYAAIYGNPNLAVGNVIGSNIANIALVLGVTALLVPLSFSRKVMRRELPVLFLVMLLFGVLIFDGVLGRFDGVVLAIATLGILWWMLRRSQGGLKIDYTEPKAMWLACVWLAVGLILLPLSTHFIIKSAVFIAKSLGISNLVIGLSIVALGTSLPELATSIAGARRKQYDLVIGNVIGSNIFNLLVVLILPALIKPVLITSDVLTRDLPIMVGVAIIFCGLTFFLRRRGQLGRFEGFVLLFIYLAYLASLVCLQGG